MNTTLLDTLKAKLGATGVLSGADISDKYAADWSRSNPQRPIAVLRPRTTDEVAFILKACHSAGQPLVVQGGLTGLCGGATPHAGEIALSLERLTGIEEIDPVSQTLTVLAGTPLETVQDAAAAAGFRFPLDLGARGSCTIGGNISTNAGGNEVIRYGMARALVLGLEAVLPDGTVISSMNRMLKNNAGFDLKQLFIGTEGTLGVVTRAVLRLFPAPLSGCTALCAAGDLPSVLKLLSHASRRFGSGLSAFEVMWADYVDFVLQHAKGVRLPFEVRHALYALIEFEGLQPETDTALFETVLEEAMTDGMVRDVVIARSEKEAANLWKIRDAIGEVAPLLTSAAHFDISAPIGAIEALIDAVKKDLAASFSGATQLTFGHLGDSNLHLVTSTGRTEDTQKLYELVYRRVGEFHGSVSAEHGIGMIKKKYLGLSRSAEEIDLMRKLKALLDPKGILNPGRVI
ncbi:MAG: FAD-binding oxidoreductase [Gammaproteobacteria bacterium]|nr:FAD-binding oxidoreductase [Gammaproteobacteria bacterium]